MIVWELPDELLPDGKTAMTIQKEYSCFLSDKATLRHDLESWRGRPFTAQELDGFDVANVLEAPCMLSVIHKVSAKKKTYATVTSVSALPKGLAAKPRVNELVHYEIEQGRDDDFKKLPEWIQKKIAACHEWRGSQPPDHEEMPPPSDLEDAGPADDNSDIPF